MREPARLKPSADGSGVAIATRAPTSVTNALTERLQVGMRVELIPTRSLGPELIEAHLRPLADPAAWSHRVQARLTSALPASALPVAAGERPAASVQPLRAEVVATSPTLVLKLVADAERATPVPAGHVHTARDSGC